MTIYKFGRVIVSTYKYTKSIWSNVFRGLDSTDLTDCAFIRINNPKQPIIPT